jgi:site-specific DNA-cytosine methylase
VIDLRLGLDRLRARLAAREEPRSSNAAPPPTAASDRLRHIGLRLRARVRTIGSLFSGIGGLELGLERAGVGRVVFQVELDPFCRAVLEKHWPGVDRSVVDVRAASASVLPRVDVLCGGFPCQDLSAAGKGAGLAGARSGLWFEFRRLVAELAPSYAVVENVASGAKRWLCEVRSGLHELGYRTTALGISAADVGAPHRRERIFVVAYAHRGRSEGSDPRHQGAGRGAAQQGGEALADTHGDDVRVEPGGIGGQGGPGAPVARHGGEALADAHGRRLGRQRLGGLLERERAAHGNDADRRGGAPALGDTDGAGLQGPLDARPAARRRRSPEPSGGLGQAQSGVGRMPPGLPLGLDRYRWPAGRGEAPHPWEPPRTVTEQLPNRRARLQALGNTVLPACAEVVGHYLLHLIASEERGAE